MLPLKNKRYIRSANIAIACSLKSPNQETDGVAFRYKCMLRALIFDFAYRNNSKFQYATKKSSPKLSRRWCDYFV